MPQTIGGNVSKDIAAGVAITTFLFAIAIYLPVFGFFCSLFVPLPIFFYRSKLGRNTGALVPIATILLMVVILGRVSIDIVVFFELLLLGFVLSELIELELTIEKTILYACSAVWCAAVAILILYSGFSERAIYSIVAEYVEKNLKLTVAMYQNMGVSGESIQTLSDSLENILYVLVRIIPALVVSSTLFVVWSNLLLARPVFRSRALFYPDYGPLNLWKAPDIFVWAVIACGILLLIPESGIRIIGLNGLIILMTLYFFQGIAIVSFFFAKKRFPVFLRVFLYSLIALQGFLLMLVVGLGFFDMWLNFRRLNPEKEG